MRNRWVIGFGVCCLHCNGNAGGAQTASPVCAEGAEERGTWQIVNYPVGLRDDLGTSDGNEFLLLGGEYCGFCQFNELDASQLSWTSHETEDFIYSSKAGNFLATTDHLAANNISTHDAASTSYPRTLALLNRETLCWSQHELPDDLETRHESSLFWTGREFLVFGGNVATDMAKVYVDETPMTSFFDGAFFDPDTDKWRRLPPAWEPGTHRFGENPPQGQTASVWTPDGLFVWGTAPDEARVRSAVYHEQTDIWEQLDASDAPPMRKRHELTYHDGFVYLFSGHGLGVELLEYDKYFSDFWRVSLADWRWEQIEVAAFADTQASQAAWVGDELVFLGHQCGYASIYDPVADTWTQASTKDSPPVVDDYGLLSLGELSAAGGRLFVNDVSLNGLTRVPAVWVFEL